MAIPELNKVDGRIDLNTLPENKQLLVARLLAEKVSDRTHQQKHRSDTDHAMAFYLGLITVSNDEIISAVTEAYEE